MLVNLQVYFSNIAILLMVISTIICLIRYKNIQKDTRILLCYFFLYLVTEILATVFFRQKINNLPLLHLYTILEFITWSWFYKSLLKNKPFFGNGFLIFLIIIVSFLVVNSIYLESIFSFNSNAKALVQIIIIGYSMHYFFSTFGKIDFSQKSNQADLIINFAVILYYSGSLFIFMFMKTLMNRNVDEGTFGFWLFNAFLLFIFQIFILVAVIKKAFGKRI